MASPQLPQQFSQQLEGWFEGLESQQFEELVVQQLLSSKLSLALPQFFTLYEVPQQSFQQSFQLKQYEELPQFFI